MADDLRSELMAIREKRGLLTAPIVVEEASDPDHPLHHRFTWDNDEAARRWRLTEAQQLLRVTFSYTTQSGRNANIRYLWPVKGTEDDDRRQYIPIEEIAMNPVASKVMEQRMRRDARAFRDRFEAHAEFLPIIREILLGEIEGNGTDG